MQELQEPLVRRKLQELLEPLDHAQHAILRRAATISTIKMHVSAQEGIHKAIPSAQEIAKPPYPRKKATTPVTSGSVSGGNKASAASRMQMKTTWTIAPAFSQLKET